MEEKFLEYCKNNQFEKAKKIYEYVLFDDEYHDHIIDDPKTKEIYGDSRNVIKQAALKNEKANPFKVIDGLGAYAAFPPDYRERLKKRLRSEKLQSYDDMEICDSSHTETAKNTGAEK